MFVTTTYVNECQKRHEPPLASRIDEAFKHSWTADNSTRRGDCISRNTGGHWTHNGHIDGRAAQSNGTRWKYDNGMEMTVAGWTNRHCAAVLLE